MRPEPEKREPWSREAKQAIGFWACLAVVSLMWIVVAWLVSFGVDVEPFYPGVWATSAPFIFVAVVLAFTWFVEEA